MSNSAVFSNLEPAQERAGRIKGGRGMQGDLAASQALAVSITRAASKQTYFTVRFLVDGGLTADAYRAYAYFRWLDDQLDQGAGTQRERLAFVERQKALMERCFRGEQPEQATVEESMLAHLLQRERGKESGLHAYVRNMMAVMAFDAERRGRLISQEELAQYTRWLAIAVTEALHYFIGHDCGSPRGEARYLAASGAHVAHMLRDTLEDTQAGYYNVPREFLESHGISPQDVNSEPYRAWVQNRAQLARASFQAGRDYLAKVENPRCYTAGYAYIARFEGVLDAIERDGYLLRPDYTDCKGLAQGVRMGWSALSQGLKPRSRGAASRPLLVE
ncbi:MAG: squalene/phytoene synthase family protein [Anaerolineales bacterium]|nr:squalene/phytoene synthase family protein [Anaerolineales bacterium]